LENAEITGQHRAADLLALDEALKVLVDLDPRRSQIVELKFFGGFNAEEIAAVLDISPSTVQREWRAAKAWLQHAMTNPSDVD
jgi:RNA polymerase sigma factor (sigma-70 family)